MRQLAFADSQRLAALMSAYTYAATRPVQPVQPWREARASGEGLAYLRQVDERVFWVGILVAAFEDAVDAQVLPLGIDGWQRDALVSVADQWSAAAGVAAPADPLALRVRHCATALRRLAEDAAGAEAWPHAVEFVVADRALAEHAVEWAAVAETGQPRDRDSWIEDRGVHLLAMLKVRTRAAEALTATGCAFVRDISLPSGSGHGPDGEEIADRRSWRVVSTTEDDGAARVEPHV